MRNPNLFIAYAPRGAGLRCALAYLASGRDVYGWYTGPREDQSIAAQYFLIEDFYSDRPMRDAAADHAELHAPWALDEARRHELARVQEAFARAAGELNLRFERIGKLDKAQPNWTYYSPHFERAVLRHLAKRWPLEYRVDVQEALA